MAATRKAKPVGIVELDTSPTELLGFYRDMLLIRRFEERAGQMYGMGLIGGFCHLYIGQEAVVVGMQAALKGGDTIVTSYRDLATARSIRVRFTRASIWRRCGSCR